MNIARIADITMNVKNSGTVLYFTSFASFIQSQRKNPDFAIKKSTNELNDQDVVTYEVKIALSGEDDIMLYPGMLVRVDLDKVGEAQ